METTQNVESHERLMTAVLNGDVSLIDDILAEEIEVNSNRQEALRAAKMKLFEAKSKVLEAESIVDLLQINYAANEIFPEHEIDETNDPKDMPCYKLINFMSNNNNEARHILAEMIKLSPFNIKYILELDKLDIRGDKIILAYKISNSNFKNLFDLITYQPEELLKAIEKANLF